MVCRKNDIEAFVGTSTLAVTPALSEPAGRVTQEPERISRVRGAENAACFCGISHTRSTENCPDERCAGDVPCRDLDSNADFLSLT